MLYSHLLAISIISGAYELVNDRTVAIRFEVVSQGQPVVSQGQPGPARAAERAEEGPGEKLSCVKRAKI